MPSNLSFSLCLSLLSLYFPLCLSLPLSPFSNSVDLFLWFSPSFTPSFSPFLRLLIQSLSLFDSLPLSLYSPFLSLSLSPFYSSVFLSFILISSLSLLLYFLFYNYLIFLSLFGCCYWKYLTWNKPIFATYKSRKANNFFPVIRPKIKISYFHEKFRI